MPDNTKMKSCPECDMGLFTVNVDPETNTIVSVECNYCDRHKQDVTQPRVLTLNQADWLGQLIRAVQASNKQSGVKLRWYPCGADEGSNEPRQMSLVMRAFTHEGGGFVDEKDDVRDAYVWCSGFTERWLKVEDVLVALDNATSGRAGMDKPMAIIDWEE
jgi:hypothetical protein